jgi:peroxiredoxin
MMALKPVSIIFAILLMLAACGPLSAEPEEAAELPATSTPSEPVPAATPEDVPTTEPVPAPEFTLLTVDGQEVSLSDYKGKWVIVNFWATWCPPCVSEMPYLQTLSDRGINVLGINLTDTADDVKKFTAEYGIEFPILMEPDINTVLDYQARQLPRTVVVAPDGSIALRISGPVDSLQLDPWLEQQGVN